MGSGQRKPDPSPIQNRSTVPHAVKRNAAGPSNAAPAAGVVRVLWLTKGFGPGGAERVIALSARHRDRDRVLARAAYLLPHKTALVPDVEAQGVKVACLDAPQAWNPRWVLRLRADLRSNPVDVVHSHSPLVAIGARLAARTLPRAQRPRLVTTFHSIWGSKATATRWADAATARWDDAQIAVSEAVRASMPAAIAERCEVVLHGVETDEVLAAAADRDEVRADLGIGPDELAVVTVANLRRPKAYPDLLAAARTVTDALPGVRFVTVGQGPLEAEIAELHRASGLGDRFALLGYRPDAARILAAADIVCQPSHAEGFPLALVEASVLGRAIVATHVGGIPEVVVDGESGVLVPPRRPDLLANALVGLANDPELRASLGAAAAARGAALSIRSAVARTEACYREVLGR